MDKLIQVPAMPAKPVTKFSAGQRAFARLVNVPVTKAPESEVAADLVGDMFASVYRAADPVDSPPVERQVNADLLHWAQESPAWGQMAQSASFNLPAALTAANVLYEFVSTDEAMKECLDKQAKAAEAEQQARAAEQMAQAMQQEEIEGAQEMAQRAGKLRQAADAAQTQAVAAMDKAQESAMTKGLVKKAVERAAGAAQEVAEVTESLGGAGFGSGAGSLTRNSVEDAGKLLERIGEKVRQIARLAGRLRGVAFSARSHRASEGIRPVGVKFTQNPVDIFPTELALLQPAAGPLRVAQAIKFADYGLMGLRRADEKPEAGPFVAAVDVSGSMRGQREVNAKALALGLAQVAKSEGRAYRLFSFSSAHDPLIECDSDQEWAAHLAWAEDFIGGGTDFDRALADAIVRLGQMEDDGRRADVVFISDGDATISRKTADAWKAFASETGARLLYVAVAKSAHDHLRRLADKVIDVADIDGQTADQLARDIGGWVQ